MLASRCAGPGSEEDRGMNRGGDGSRFGLCLIIILQLDGLDFGSRNRFSLQRLESGEARQDGENDPGKDASPKDEDAEDKRDEFHKLGSLDRTERAWGRFRFWGGLARSELRLDTGIRGRLSRSQGGLGCLVMDVVNVNRRKLVG